MFSQRMQALALMNDVPSRDRLIALSLLAMVVTASNEVTLDAANSTLGRTAMQQANAWIVEDDYDSEYRYTGPPLASLQSLDKSAGVIYVGTLSKVLFPGLRLGYLVLPPALVDAFAQERRGRLLHRAVGNGAHLGGLLFGLVLGYIFLHRRRS